MRRSVNWSLRDVIQEWVFVSARQLFTPLHVYQNGKHPVSLFYIPLYHRFCVLLKFNPGLKYWKHLETLQVNYIRNPKGVKLLHEDNASLKTPTDRIYHSHSNSNHPLITSLTVSSFRFSAPSFNYLLHHLSPFIWPTPSICPYKTYFDLVNTNLHILSELFSLVFKILYS